MGPAYEDDQVTVYSGDCISVLKQLPAESVQVVVTSPPY
jgi:DNA modification methylase